MKSRIFSFTSLIALLVAMMAAPSAMAQTTPAQDVYNPNGEVLDVVEGGGGKTSGGETSVCAEADGQDGDGNTVAYGSEEDCSGAAATPTVSEGELPFTGFEAGMVGLAGLALLGGGFAMRGVAKRNA